MQKKFHKHIQQHFPFLAKCRFYIAVSGGIDSMVLVHLFQHYQYEFGLLHCNFKLRGDESDGDMRFIHDYSEENTLHLRIGFFETMQYAKQNKVSTQVAARELRYEWFYEQMEEMNAQYVLTAHHLDDNLETFIINLSRGTGLEGLTGIPQQNDKILRPLLPFSREEIQEYAKENNIKWREDSSNSSDKYLRNKIRHDLIPILKEINPSFLTSFQNTQEYLCAAQTLVNDADYYIYREVATETEDGKILFNLKQLLQLPNYSAYLYQWLKEFNFTAWQDVYSLVNAQSGKQVFSTDVVLLKDRDYLILSKKKINSLNEVYYVTKNGEQVNFPLKFQFCNVSDISDTDSNSIFVDENKIEFPLVLRKWEEADYFYPFGMEGKKKVSKYFKDEKFSLIDKSNVWLLCSNNQIVWIVGKRQDDRFKITENTTKILQISRQT